MRVAQNPSSRSRVTAALLLLALLGALAPPASAAPLFGGRPRREGDILKIFDRAVVYVVTNDDAALADVLLEGCQQKERRILSLADWQKLPTGASWYFSVVFLINRERLPLWQRIPETCAAEGDEIWTQAVRSGRDWGVAHDVTISAPDGAWLRRAVTEFRTLKEPPRNPLRKNVRSVAVVPLGVSAVATAQGFLKAKGAPVAHLLPMERYEAASGRLATADEILLVDRSAVRTEAVPPTVAALLSARTVGHNETVAWRERKEKGRARVVFSAPNSDLLTEALRRYPEPMSVPETPTVLASARDLRSVRRIAVAGVRGGVGGPDLARRLASAAATQVRALDAFEVLERAGLNEILAEIALGQAGITKAQDRARVRHLAAADALLIVEVTDVAGRTEYATSQERLTPRMGSAPPRPLEPSRLRVMPRLPGRENDRLLHTATELLLRRVVGLKSEDEYKDALDDYNTRILPRWQAQVDDYHYRHRTRQIAWRQKVLARGTATVSGSLRLVDLIDGLVLWEAPFTATDTEDAPVRTVTATSLGENSSPPPPVSPGASSDVSDTLIARIADTALAQGIQALRGTTLLPPPLTAISTALGPAVLAPSAADPPAPSGRVLDVDGDILLIGLGAGDGLKLGDTLRVTLDGGRTVRATVTRVRPRTCDARFDPEAPADLRALVTAGQTVAHGGGK